MHTTPPSLLLRIRDPADQAAWQEFDQRYREWLIRFFRGRGLSFSDAEDLTQRVFSSLFRSLPQFTYDPNRGRFRTYLFRCARNALSAWAARPPAGVRALEWNGQAESSESEDPELQRAWEEEWVAHHYRIAFAELRKSASARDLTILERSMSGVEIGALARELGMQEEAVYKARQRIRRRMQELIAQQIAEEDRVDE